MSERIVFSRTLYTAEAVKTAASAYAALTKVEVEVSDTEVVAEFENAPTGELVDAFCNHALYETVVQRRRQIGEGLV